MRKCILNGDRFTIYYLVKVLSEDSVLIEDVNGNFKIVSISSDKVSMLDLSERDQCRDLEVSNKQEFTLVKDIFTTLLLREKEEIDIDKLFETAKNYADEFIRKFKN